MLMQNKLPAIVPILLIVLLVEVTTPIPVPVAIEAIVHIEVPVEVHIIRILQARMEAVAVHRFIHLLLKQLAIIHLATGHCPRGFMAPT